MVVGLIGLLGLEQLVVSLLQALPDGLLSQSRIGVLKMVLVISQLQFNPLAVAPFLPGV